VDLLSPVLAKGFHTTPWKPCAAARPGRSARERYLDPEPLIAIWPLWIVEDGKGHVSTAAPPGLPVRVPPKPRTPPPVQSDQAAQNDNQPATPAAAEPAPATTAN
jgi:hypothetical protein